MVEQEALQPEIVPPEQRKRRSIRHQEGERATPAKTVRRTAANTIIPLPAKKLRTTPVPEHAPAITDLALRHPSIVAFPGFAMSAAASSPTAHTSPQHSHGKLSVRQCLSELRGALAEGWEIVQPIFARPLWSVTDDSTTAFNFVLRRELATRLVVVPEGRTVERFIRDRHLLVDYRR
jgi:hypothetical protein